MAKRGRRRTAEQDSDYDGAWKEVLRQHLPEILAKYLPTLAAAIDWRHPPQWSDKELGRILRQRRRRPRSVDALVKVRLLSGTEQWILLHLEIQSSRETGFEFRIFRSPRGVPADRLDDEPAGRIEPDIRRRTRGFGGGVEHDLRHVRGTNR